MKICVNELRKANGLKPLPSKEADKVYCRIDLSSQKDFSVAPRGSKNLCAKAEGDRSQAPRETFSQN